MRFTASRRKKSNLWKARQNRTAAPPTKPNKSATAGDAAAIAKIAGKIDEIVYRLFDLTVDEIAHIETSLVNTRGQSADDNDDGDE